MPVAHPDTKELLNLILIYLPSALARQLLGDIYRSKAYEHDRNLRVIVWRLIEALDQRGPTSYVKEQGVQS